MRTANGGERFSLALPNGINPEDMGPSYAGLLQALKAVGKDDEELPRCVKCHAAVAGLMQLPCQCSGEVCGECFRTYKCNLFQNKRTKGKGVTKCPMGCRKIQRKHEDWAPLQPRLILQTDAAAMQKDAKEKQKQGQKASDKVIKEQRAQHVSAMLRKQPPARQLASPPTLTLLSSMSNKIIEKSAKDVDGAGGKVIYLA